MLPNELGVSWELVGSKSGVSRGLAGSDLVFGVNKLLYLIIPACSGKNCLENQNRNPV